MTIFKSNKNLEQKSHKKFNLHNLGFTMVEMLVVVGIFTVLTATVIFQYGNFNSQTIMTNMAYEVALATRQAQVFSLGVRGQSGINNFDNRYGVYFDTNMTEKDFVFFIDYGEEGSPESANSICDNEIPNGDGEGNCFACITGDECLEKFTLTRDITLDKICLVDGNDPLASDDSGDCASGADSVSAATITFERPNPDAIIRDPNNVSEDSYKSAAIILTTRFGDQRAVVIKSTGQISVEVLNDK
jgi:prepilin-type N-terminal cleavage/methylation domain-containing protein